MKNSDIRFLKALPSIIAALGMSSLFLNQWAYASDVGAELYEQHCAACHGIHGQGGTGVPLALDDFQREVTDQFLFNTIKHGRPGRVMPSYAMLSEAQIMAIVKHIRSFSNVKVPAYDDALIMGDVKNGKKLFMQHCAACHGEQGQGAAGTGVTFSRPRDYPILAPALNNSGFLSSATDQDIKRTLVGGRKGTPMRSFTEAGLKEKEVDDIVSYIRSFEKNLIKPVDVDEELFIEFESDSDLATVIENIKRAAEGKNFRMIRIQNMDNGFVDEKAESGKEVIIYFCNFKLLNQALKVDSRVGLFLPCRVTAYEQDGKVKVIAINPRRLSHLFNNNELDRLCDEMHKTYVEILEEATF
jgi:cytochrome c oxidase cbb3-type subunit 3